MVEIGYALSSEEHAPLDLVRHAELADKAGFGFALLGTGVTCTTVRIHPAVIAQAAATAATLMPGRFFLGVGSGEALNEHILGDKWPPADVRLQMLEESIEVLRLLWKGGQQSFYGEFFEVENARIYDLPERPVQVMVAASGERAAELAGRIGDGFISTAPKKELIGAFKKAGTKRDRPRYGQMTVSWARTKKQAVETALEWWPTAAVHGELSQELPLPAHFEQAATDVTAEQIKKAITCGPDIEPLLERIEEFARAGFSHVYIHQVGPDQEGFIDFCAKQLLPLYERSRTSR